MGGWTAWFDHWEHLLNPCLEAYLEQNRGSVDGTLVSLALGDIYVSPLGIYVGRADDVRVG